MEFSANQESSNSNLGEPKMSKSDEASTLFDVPIRDLDSAIASAGFLLSSDAPNEYLKRLDEAQSITQETLMLEVSV